MLPDPSILSQVAPVRLTTGDDAAPIHSVLPLWVGLFIVIAAIIVTVIAWLITARNDRIEADAAEYAFRALARRQRIPKAQQRLLRRLGEVAKTAPVALLLSDHALAAAALCLARANPSKRERAALESLLSR
jgi:hypothetical protein